MLYSHTIATNQGVSKFAKDSPKVVKWSRTVTFKFPSFSKVRIRSIQINFPVIISLNEPELRTELNIFAILRNQTLANVYETASKLFPAH